MNKYLKTGIYAIFFSLFIMLLPSKVIANDLREPYKTTVKKYYTTQELLSIFEEFLKGSQHFGKLYKVSQEDNDWLALVPSEKHKSILIHNNYNEGLISFIAIYKSNKKFPLQKVNALNQSIKAGNVYVDTDNGGKELWLKYSLSTESGVSAGQIILGFIPIMKLQQSVEDAGLVN